MAKEIPFFKFYVGEWANGDITAESFELQGVFINICSIYWSKEGNLTKRFIIKKFGENLINELICSKIIKSVKGEIYISFLDEQLEECEGIRSQASNAGKASAVARAKEKAKKKQFNDRSTTVQRPLDSRSTELQPIREDNIREDNIREEKKEKRINSSAKAESEFITFWNLYGKKVGKEKSLLIFKRLKDSERKLILETLPAYIASTPDLLYRKNPQTYLNGQHWKDEIITEENKTKNFTQPKFYEDEL